MSTLALLLSFYTLLKPWFHVTAEKKNFVVLHFDGSLLENTRELEISESLNPKIPHRMIYWLMLFSWLNPEQGQLLQRKRSWPKLFSLWTFLPSIRTMEAWMEWKDLVLTLFEAYYLYIMFFFPFPFVVELLSSNIKVICLNFLRLLSNSVWYLVTWF